MPPAQLAQPLVEERRLRGAAARRVDHDRDRAAAGGAEGTREHGVEALQVDQLAVAPRGGEAAVAQEGRVQEHVRRKAGLVRVRAGLGEGEGEGWDHATEAQG